MMIDKAAKIDHLNTKATIITSDSEIAFKDIISYVKCDLQQEIESTDYSINVFNLYTEIKVTNNVMG